MRLAPSGPPQEFNYTNISVHEIGIRWNFPQFPNGVITGFTVSTTFLCKYFICINFNRYIIITACCQYQSHSAISVHYHVQLLLITWSHSLLTLLKFQVVLELEKDHVQTQSLSGLPLKVS